MGKQPGFIVQWAGAMAGAFSPLHYVRGSGVPSGAVAANGGAGNAPQKERRCPAATVGKLLFREGAICITIPPFNSVVYKPRPRGAARPPGDLVLPTIADMMNPTSKSHTPYHRRDTLQTRSRSLRRCHVRPGCRHASVRSRTPIFIIITICNEYVSHIYSCKDPTVGTG